MDESVCCSRLSFTPPAQPVGESRYRHHAMFTPRRTVQLPRDSVQANVVAHGDPRALVEDRRDSHNAVATAVQTHAAAQTHTSGASGFFLVPTAITSQIQSIGRQAAVRGWERTWRARPSVA